MQQTPSTDLYDRIINRINREEQFIILKKRLILSFFCFFISFPAFLFLGWKLLTDLSNSGLAQFLPLLLSDFNVVMVNLGDYVLGILESAPALSLSLTLTALLALVFNLAKLADSYGDFKKIRHINI
ncbi:MAG: hypothetical protein Q7K16_01650 [Candidatus Azambacteria bacterium]|nr:hypothetical protein [Candidatus Azambacteria bacterium]